MHIIVDYGAVIYVGKALESIVKEPLNEGLSGSQDSQGSDTDKKSDNSKDASNISTIVKPHYISKYFKLNESSKANKTKRKNAPLFAQNYKVNHKPDYLSTSTIRTQDITTDSSQGASNSFALGLPLVSYTTEDNVHDDTLDPSIPSTNSKTGSSPKKTLVQDGVCSSQRPRAKTITGMYTYVYISISKVLVNVSRSAHLYFVCYFTLLIYTLCTRIYRNNGIYVS